MGKLIRNGIEYGGGNGTDIFEVTQAEYDALVQAGTLVHNALYVITDAPNLNPTSSDIEYSSGVTVKQAIDSKQNKTWTLLGTLTGSETLTLPTGWNEALIVGRFGGNAQYGFTSYIIALHGGTNPYRFINGCGQTSDNHQAIWSLGGDNKVGLQMWKYNGTDYTSTSSLLVYYR